MRRCTPGRGRSQVAAVALAWMACTPGAPDGPQANATQAAGAGGVAQGAPAWAELAEATYPGVTERPVRLADGGWEGSPYLPGGASRPRVHLVRDFHLTGDLDGDGVPEAAVLLEESSGGSGTWRHLAVATRRGAEIAILGTANLGDRVELRDAHVEARVLVLDVVRAGPDDPACCPTQHARRRFQLTRSGLEELPGSEAR